MADAWTSSKTGPVLRLKARLPGIGPMIWRRLQVPETLLLHELHGVLQVATGWEAIHLFQFGIHGIIHAGPFLPGRPVDMPLSGFRFRRIAKFRYDFGCWWNHELRVEDRISATPGKRNPTCICGSGASSPEECGGPVGYFAGREDATGLEALEDIQLLAEVGVDSGTGEMTLCYGLTLSSIGIHSLHSWPPSGMTGAGCGWLFSTVDHSVIRGLVTA